LIEEKYANVDKKAIFSQLLVSMKVKKIKENQSSFLKPKTW